MTYRKTMLSASIVTALMFTGVAMAGPSQPAKNQPAQPQNTTTQQSSSSSTANQENAEKLKGVTVTGTIGSLLRATTTKRTNVGIVDSISAKEAGQFPDQTVAGALQRVPGVAVDRSADGVPNEISVRGFGPQFVTVLLDGDVMANASYSQGVSLDILPVQILQQAIVYKTSQASLPAGGIGGTVNIKTWQPLEFNGFHVTARLGGRRLTLPGQTNETKTTPDLSGLIGDTNKSGTFGWLLAAEFEKRDEQYTSRSTDWTLTTFPNDPTQAPVYNAPVVSANYTFLHRTRKTADLALEAQPTPRLRINGNFVIMRHDGNTHAIEHQYAAEAAQIKSIVADKNDTAISYTTNTNGLAQNVFRQLESPTHIRQMMWNLKLHYRFPDDYVIEVKSDASQASNKIPIAYGGVEGYPTNLILPMRFTNPGHGVFPYISGGTPSTEASNVHTQYDENKGSSVSNHIFANKIVLKHDFESGIISSAAVGIVSRSVTFRTSGTTLPQNGNLLIPYYDAYAALIPAVDIGAHVVTFNNLGGKFGKNTVKSFVSYDPTKVISFLSSPAAYDQLSPAHRQSLLKILKFFHGTFPLTVDPSKFARVHELDDDAFGGMTLQSTVDQHKWSMVLGIRYVRTRTASEATLQPLLEIINDAPEPYQPFQKLGKLQRVNRPGKYHEFLPSMNFKLHLLSNVLFRAAYSKTMTRPELDDLSAARHFGLSIGNWTSSTGNPSLKPYLSRNFDVGASWFIGPVSYLSFDYFEKKLTNFVTELTTNVPDASLIPTIDPAINQHRIDQGIFLTRPVNLNKATAKGYEATANYQFGWLPGIWNGFGILANYTHVSSNAALNTKAYTTGIGSTFAIPGMGSSYNASLYYDKNPLDIRLSLNVRNGYLVNPSGPAGDPTFAKRYGELDLSASYRFNKHTSVYFDAQNLTNATVFQYSIFENRPLLGSEFGRTFEFGINWTL